MKPYPAYKASGVPWLGEVPSHWNVQRLRFCCKLNPGVRVGLNEGDVASFLPMEAVGDDGSLNLEATRPIGDVISGYTYFEDGDVTIAKITPCFENGKGAVMRGLQGGVGFGTTELIVIRPNDTVHPDWLYYLTQSDTFRKRGEAMMYGAGGQKRVPDLYVKDFPIAWPPIKEQEAVATYLDRETARIDMLLAEKGRLTDTLREYRQATISEVVTQGLDHAATKKPSGVPWLGEIPAHWGLKRLKFHVEQVGEKTSEPLAGVAYIGLEHIESGTGKFISSIDGTQTESESTVSHFRVGDVLFGKLRPYLAKAVIAYGDGVCTTELLVLRPHSMDSGYLLRCLLLDGFIKTVDASTFGAKMPRAEWTFISNLLLPEPPVAEQQAIAAYLDHETTRIDKLVAHVQDEIKLLQELRSATITDAVTGKIKVS